MALIFPLIIIVKKASLEFPKNSTIIGVLEDPIRALSVGYHTGWTNNPSKYMRMDEIEVGEYAKRKACQSIVATNTTKVFEEDKVKREEEGLSAREPRYSVIREWAIKTKTPNECVAATYRIEYQKVDKEIYSDSH